MERIMRHVFISYIREDQSRVDSLKWALYCAGVDVWVDREQIQPGERWKYSIRKAIEDGAFFIACFSREYMERERTYMNEELILAIDELRKRPFHRAWFIPVLLDGVEIPPREIGGGETLRDLQWVDLSENWNAGLLRILRIIKPSPVDAKVAQAREKLRKTVRENPSDLSAAMSDARRLVLDSVIQEFANKEDMSRYGFEMFPVLEENIDILTAEHVVQLVERGGIGNSRTGFHALNWFYNKYFDNARRLKLPVAFQHNPIIAYYCKLREKFAEWSLDRIVYEASNADLIIDGMTVDRDEYFDKHPNRGSSAFLDAVYRVD
jgi:hypothetical protein